MAKKIHKTIKYEVPILVKLYRTYKNYKIIKKILEKSERKVERQTETKGGRKR